jgi:hypothetical protein
VVRTLELIPLVAGTYNFALPGEQNEIAVQLSSEMTLLEERQETYLIAILWWFSVCIEAGAPFS